MKEFKCGTIVPGCESAFRGESDDEVLAQIGSHARNEHGMDEVPPEVLDTIRANIVEVAIA